MVFGGLSPRCQAKYTDDMPKLPGTLHGVWNPGTAGSFRKLMLSSKFGVSNGFKNVSGVPFGG